MKSRPALLQIFLAALLVSGSLWATESLKRDGEWYKGRTILAEKESMFGQVFVVQEGPHRFLRFASADGV